MEKQDRKTSDVHETAVRTLAIMTLGIDVDDFKQAMIDAGDCRAALTLLADRSDCDQGLALLLRSVNGYLENVTETLKITGGKLGIEAA